MSNLISKLKYIQPRSLKLRGGEIKLKFPLIKYSNTGPKILYVADCITKADLESGKFFTSDMGNTIQRAFEHAVHLNNDTPPQSIFITSTYLYKRTKTLSEAEQANNSKKVLFRLTRLIHYYKPDTVIMTNVYDVMHWIRNKQIKFRDNYKILNDSKTEQNLKLFLGRLLPVMISGFKCNLLLSFSPRALASSDPTKYANTVQLLGFCVRHFETALHNKNLYDLAPYINPKYRIITNLKQFKKFFRKLLSSRITCIDTETRNLNRIYNNTLLMLLFSMDGESCWALPYHHPKSPFTPKELQYIEKSLRWYFESAPTTVTIYHNSIFDLHQIFSHLKIRYYNHKIFDIMYSTFNLDENRKFFRSADIKKAYTLELIACQHGGLGYFDTNIAKVDRANMISYSIENIAEYARFDIVYPYQIARMQIQEAKRRGEAYSGFFKAVTELSSDHIYTFREMESNGLLVDRHQLTKYIAPNNEIDAMMVEAQKGFRESKAVAKANEQLKKIFNIPNGKGIFGDNTATWIFDINKQKHQQVLFIDTLQLEPVKFRKDGGAKLGKEFIAEYEETVPEVKLLSKYTKLKQIKSTYIKGIFKLLTTEDDGKDFRLRSFYNLISILTARTASTKPNMQNIPSRGPLAKIIKRFFIASFGKIIVKLDFSAHEVRMWCNIAQDKMLANSFALGSKLRTKLRILRSENLELDAEFIEWREEVKWNDKKTSYKDKEEAVNRLHNNKKLRELAEILLELEVKGDLHKVNYQHFYNKNAADVTDDERQGIKQVVFGTIYGKMAMALARDIYKEVKNIERKFRKKLRQHEEGSDEYQEVIFERAKELKPHKEKAQNLISTLFTKFKSGGDWIKSVQAEAQKTFSYTSIFGIVRHVWGYLHHENSVHGMMDRRITNTMIQGPSSNIGYTGAKIMLDLVWQFTKKKIDIGYKHCNSVHDCIAGDTLIHTSRGLIRIDELANGKSQNIDITVAGRFKNVKVNRWINKGIRPTRKITTELGNHITGTYRHQLLVKDLKGNIDYKKLKDIKVGEYLYIPLRNLASKHILKLNLSNYKPKMRETGRYRTLKLESISNVAKINNSIVKPKFMTPELAFCLALIISEGSIRQRSVQIPNSDKKLLEKMSFYMNEIFGLKGNIRPAGRPGLSKKLQYVAEFNSILLPKWLEELGLYCGGYKDNKSPSHSKVVPWCILQADRESQLAFLAGYIEGDGALSNETCFRSMSKTILTQIQAILLSHGYYARKRLSTNKSSSGMVVLDNINSVRLSKECKKYWVTKKYKSKFTASISRYQTNNDCLIVKVISNEKDLDQPVYDLTVKKGEPAYVANGIISHNSLETESKLKALPLNLYYLEHSMTTLVHKRLKEVYGFDIMVGLEIEIEIGGSLGAMHKWDFSSSHLFEIVDKSIDWMQTELGYQLDKKDIMKAIKHNQGLITPYRSKELQILLDDFSPQRKILLTPEKAALLDWKL